MLKIETENKKLIWKLPEKESDQLFTHLSLQLIELTGGVAKGAAETDRRHARSGTYRGKRQNDT